MSQVVRLVGGIFGTMLVVQQSLHTEDQLSAFSSDTKPWYTIFPVKVLSEQAPSCHTPIIGSSQRGQRGRLGHDDYTRTTTVLSPIP
jgi:hypothetical protein